MVSHRAKSALRILSLLLLPWNNFFPYLRENSITMFDKQLPPFIVMILAPFIAALTPQISFVNIASGGAGSRTVQRKAEELEAARKRKTAVAKAKAEKLQRDFARRQQTKALSR